ncbi:MAG: hypothetical protein QM774_11080 [Gordonia sp. (in: high G+C Gram-positive bacteria)]|uniref:hypothetical protein n=1 Tax=Gordonia sp. (in: high G+C Gram-positive bacteria) TaxID=84139 RepID=UPI0039E35345
MRHVTKVLAGGMLAGSAVLLTACGGYTHHDDSKGAQGSGGSAKAADPALVQDLVLPAAEFPSGFQAQEVPKGPEMQQMMDQTLSSVKDSTITPAHCKQASAIPDTVKLDDMGMAMGMKGTDTAAVVVMAQKTDLGTQRTMLADGCDKLSVTMNSGVAAGASGTTEQHEVTAPKTAADDAMVIESKTAMSYQGQSVNSTGRVGMAEVNGYTVTVQFTSQQGDVDDAAFDDVFTKAVDRVAQKSA